MKPNIILINCDDLGWGDLGCMGHPYHKTPVLDKMAAEGLRLTDFVVGSAVCSASRAALLTGCYPRRIGFAAAPDDWGAASVLSPGCPKGLSTREQTIAGVLKPAGYATRIIGKWHCGDQPEFLPTRHGFDGYYGLPYSNDMARSAKRPNYAPLPLMRDEEVIEAQPDQAALVARYTEDAKMFLRDNQKKPFFLYLAHLHVHLPHYVLPRFLDENPNPYAAAVAAVDWSTGAILDEVKRLGLDENTLVIFTSDNGSKNQFGPSSGVLRGNKGTTWEAGHRVPCLVRWAGHITPGRVSGEMLASMDFLATFAKLAGATMPPDTDSLDASDFLLGKSDTSPRKDFFYYDIFGTLNAVRAEDWKLHVHRRPQTHNAKVATEAISELYNLRTDMGEENNVAEQHPDIVERLRSRLDACRAELGEDLCPDGASVAGAKSRKIIRLAESKPLTKFDPAESYYMAEYDLTESG